jgi:nitroreductase
MAACLTGAIGVTGRRLSRDDAFPLSARSERATADALEGLLQARRSTRHYDDRPIAKDTVDRLLAMASTAPMGFPPTDVGVVVINGKERVQELAADLTGVFKKWQFFANPVGYSVLRLMAGKATAALMKSYVLPVVTRIVEERKRQRDLLFYNAPCVLLFHYPLKDSVDSTIACTVAVVAAEALGLGSCMIGTVPPALQNDRKLKVKWGVPAASRPFIAMILGHPALEYRRGIRRRFASVKYV